MKSIFSVALLFTFLNYACADTLYLKNGHSIEGIIKSDDGKTLELEVGIDSSVSFLKSEIESISKSPNLDSLALRQGWERHKLEADERMAKSLFEKEAKPDSISFSQELQGIAVNVTLNNKVKAKMVLDTGASTVVIARKVADELKINLNKVESDMKTQAVDGRRINAKRIILESVQVQGVEAKNVEAVVLLDDSGKPGFGDGLLGMSFLKRFNFKVDQKEKKLILEKLYGATVR